MWEPPRFGTFGCKGNREDVVKDTRGRFRKLTFETGLRDSTSRFVRPAAVKGGAFRPPPVDKQLSLPEKDVYPSYHRR